jgi:prepilin-type N-terminal cleavage/methylation domain-containing protein
MIARLRSERGVTLVETLIAVAILGAAVVVFLAGLSTGTLATAQADKLSTAHELARSQMELTKAAAYSAAPHTYPTVTPPTTYGVSAVASTISEGDADVELVTVQVTKDGVAVYTLEGYKVNR